MNHKAFTLIELLAVIVILAIIVMIAVPQVGKTIETAEKNTLLTSAKNIIRTIEYGIVNGTITDGDLIFDGNNKPIQTTNKITEIGTAIINNKDISLNICNTKYCASKSFNEKEITVTEKENLIEIKKIEDLITLSNEVNAGDIKANKIYVLRNDLDFLDQNSYYNYQTTEFGDVNKNGTVEALLTELTTVNGFPGIGLWETGGTIEENFYEIVIPFSGIFDGQNKSIDNLYMENYTTLTGLTAAQDPGLFPFIENAEVKNIVLTGTLKTHGGYSGLLIGNSYGSDITNCHVTGNVTGVRQVNDYNNYFSAALLLGWGDVNEIYDETLGKNVLERVGKISDSSANGTIINTGDRTGIFAGVIWGSDVYNSYSKGSITMNRTTISKVGGFVGQLDHSYVHNCFSDTDISLIPSTTIQDVGGFVGYISTGATDFRNTEITNSYSRGILNGATETGGFIGQNTNSAGSSGIKYSTIMNVYSLNTMSINLVNPNGGGGIVGTALMNIEDSFFAGDITTSSTNTLAGLVIGKKENLDTTYDNAYHKENSIITGTHNTFGTIATLNNLKSKEWYKNTLHFDDNFQYNDGYYPILYKIDPDTLLPTKTLIPNQDLVEVK